MISPLKVYFIDPPFTQSPSIRINSRCSQYTPEGPPEFRGCVCIYFIANAYLRWPVLVNTNTVVRICALRARKLQKPITTTINTVL